MAGFLRKKTKVETPVKPSSSRPNEPVPTSTTASPPSTPLFARFASTQASSDNSNAQKPLVSSPMMLSSRRETSSPTKRHVSAGQPMQYGALEREENGAGGGPSSFDAEKASRMARSVSAQSPAMATGRARNVSSPTHTLPSPRTSNVEKPLPSILPVDLPPQHVPSNRINGNVSSTDSPVSPQKRKTSANLQSAPRESRSSVLVKPTIASSNSNGRRTSTDFSVAAPHSPEYTGSRNLPRKSSAQDLGHKQTNANRLPSNSLYNDYNGSPSSSHATPMLPPSAFRQPVENETPSVLNDVTSDDFDLWLRSAQAATIAASPTPPPPQDPPSPKISRKTSQQGLAPVEQPTVKLNPTLSNAPIMRGKPLIFSAMATVDTVPSSPPAPPAPAPPVKSSTNGIGPNSSYTDVAKSYPSPPAELSSSPTQYHNAPSFSPQQTHSLRHPDGVPKHHEPSRRQSAVSPRGRPSASYISPENPPLQQEQNRRQSLSQQQPLPRKVSTNSRPPEAPTQTQHHRTLTKPRPTTPTKQRPTTPQKQRPSTPKHRPVTPVSPEKVESPIRNINNTGVLSAALYDDDPFAKTQGVKMLQPAARERDDLPLTPKEKENVTGNNLHPKLDQSSTSLASLMNTNPSRDTLATPTTTAAAAVNGTGSESVRPSTSGSIRPSTGSGSVRNSHWQEDESPIGIEDREVNRTVIPPPPPQKEVPTTPSTPEDYRSARTKRRGDKLAAREVPDEVKALPIREDRPAEPFPLPLFVAEPALVSNLLSYLSFWEWCTLLCLSKGIRATLWESPQLKEEVLERYLDTVGYLRWTWPEQEPLALSLEDLHHYMRGVSLPTHEYARASELILHNRGLHPSQRDESVSEKETQLVLATRAYNRVLLRLRAQAEKEASNPSASAMSPSSFKHAGGNSPRMYPASQPSSRAPSPTRSSFSHSHGHGHNQPIPPLPTINTPSSAGRSPLFRLRRAPLLRVFVPSPDGDWLSDSSVLECEAELKRAGIRSLVRFGDVIWDVAVGDEGNVGRMIWDGKYLIDLDYTYSKVGDLPKYVPAFAFPPSYFHRVIRTGPASSNPIVRVDLTPWGPEIAANLQLLQDRVRTETPQGAYHNVVRWVHRSSFVIRPPHGGGSSNNGKRNASRSRPGRIPIPDWSNLFVDPGWYGTMVVETEGTNESLADLQDRCGPGAFPPRAPGTVAPTTANGKEREKDIVLEKYGFELRDNTVVLYSFYSYDEIKKMGSSRQVNDMLHSLRGEQFRQSRNKSRSRRHISSSTFSRDRPSLPLDLVSLSLHSEETQDLKVDESISSSSTSKYSGPAPPKSWTAKRSTEEVSSVLWRRQALSTIFRGWKPLSEPVLPLTLICISKILSYGATTDEFEEEILPCIPPHLRLELLRYSAVFAPLCNTRLSAMMAGEGHVEGELIIVGPNGSLNEDHFFKASSPISRVQSHTPEDHDWDSDDPSPNPLRLLALVSTKLGLPTLLSLPPTITHMALIKLPTPIPLHRLPSVCPLLELLDLSYNLWLQPPSEETTRSLERLDWGKWRRLETLGIRECSIPEETIAMVNRGRWDDVVIIQ
ncbi:hypothetical protein V5O48_000478 [Marasmius crinis-equi]|uniref:F-box domain-containing protein n=1 Tax=Marasmius crinis-equi TaxID=585013 RepID=A0ABR3G142_9AGAR